MAKRNLVLFLVFAIIIFMQISSAEEENILGVKILSLNKEHNFLVIDAGSKDGLSEGMMVNLLKEGKKIASLQVIRVKEKVSACDIKQTEPNIILREREIYSLVVSPTLFPAKPHKLIPQKEIKKIEKVEKVPQIIPALPMMVHIEARREIVNYYLNEILRDMNFIITSSNIKEGIFTAHKFLTLPLWDELWADLIGTTDHRAVYEINTIDDETGTTLKLDIRITYTNKKGEMEEKSVRQNSAVVKDALTLVKLVKEKSEILTRER
ncbi:MAG: hypothetical protein NC920_04150 [Candidatus Omnitrophica bacterium]|nr:hypothetical protein [Candidatus Omnitrophota bacterium]